MTEFIEYPGERLFSKPSIASRLPVTIACIALIFASKKPIEALIATLFSLSYMLYSTRSLSCLKVFSAIALPVSGVFAYTLLTSGLYRALELSSRIIVLASSSIALVYSASVGEILWLARVLGRSYTTAIISLASLESALMIRVYAKEAFEGVRARGLSSKGFRGALKKYTVIARILFYKALVRAEGTAEILALGMIDPRRVKPLYKPRFTKSDLILTASLAVSLAIYLILK